MDIATLVGLVLGIILIGGSMFLESANSGLSIINFFGAFYASQVDYIPSAAVYGHVILGLLPIFPAYFLLTGKIETID